MDKQDDSNDMGAVSRRDFTAGSAAMAGLAVTAGSAAAADVIAKDVMIKTPDGKVMLAPAQVYKRKQNSEVPELYAVFPFRQIAVGKPNLEWGVEALNRRIDKGACGWRQDDIFMAWLGQSAQARDYVVQRARSKHGASRFPAFWGPNFDWIPDQDHGSVLLIALQSMLLQADGRKIYLLPAWPKDWDCEFKLHAPYNTTVEGVIKAGKLEQLKVTPASRRADIVNMLEK